jgi:hypothetical protein
MCNGNERIQTQNNVVIPDMDNRQKKIYSKSGFDLLIRAPGRAWGWGKSKG